MRADIEQALARRDYQRLTELIGPGGSGVGAGDPALARLGRFAANMLALRARDRSIAEEIEGVPASGRVRIVTAPDGLETLSLASHSGSDNPLCPGGSPSRARQEADRHLRESPEKIRSVACAGVGDGTVVSTFAQEPPDPVGWRRVVFVIEPDAEVFRSAMMLHDWSGPGGPLVDGRFRLVVGRSWRERLSADLAPDGRLPPPARAVRQCVDPRPIAAAIQASVEAARSEAAARRGRLVEMYGRVTPSVLAERLGAIAGARVLLLTTRYSTVLQYSTRDYAVAFEHLGAVARVVIEEQPWEQHVLTSLLGELERFRPDLVIQIDHHRHETPDTFPVPVPFVCVIQDNLPNLTTREAGRRMGPTDFAAGSWVRQYALEFGYPAERCIEIPRLTAAPAAPAVHIGGGDDLLYVSNHSTTPERAIEAAAVSAGASAGAIVRAAGEDLAALYAAGGCVEDETQLPGFILESCARRGLREPPAESLGPLAVVVNVSINNPLYRQQGLGWAVSAAERLGLSVAVYGKGWEDHPRFARHARGRLDYARLPDLSARAWVCLVLEPYFPTQHQRALDTWMWGGLPLIRLRDRDRQQGVFNDWIGRLPPGVHTLEDALGVLDGPARDGFLAVYERQQGLHAWDGRGDLVALYRGRARDGIGDLMDLPPGLAETSFVDEASLEAVVGGLVDDRSRHAGLRRAQHDWARERFRYERGARRILEKVAERLGARSGPGQ